MLLPQHSTDVNLHTLRDARQKFSILAPREIAQALKPREVMFESIEIPLLRGGRIVSSLAGALGSALRETRLTAMLGYVNARN